MKETKKQNAVCYIIEGEQRGKRILFRPYFDTWIIGRREELDNRTERWFRKKGVYMACVDEDDIEMEKEAKKEAEKIVYRALNEFHDLRQPLSLSVRKVRVKYVYPFNVMRKEDV